MSQDDLDNCYDIVANLITNDSETVGSYTGLGGLGEFSISVMKFYNVYWIEAPEFDDVGYFESLENAKDAAEFNYEPFITAWNEAKEKGEIE